MNKYMSLDIKPQEEVNKIIRFIRSIFKNSVKQTAVLGWSGGIDSTVALYLLIKALGKTNVHVYHLPYLKSYTRDLIHISQLLEIPSSHLKIVSIKQSVNTVIKTLKSRDSSIGGSVLRKGNVMARIRMVILFDQANKLNSLVCGTENRTEKMLGYFTRFGDAASDIEPISHLYKTQIYQLARYLKIDKNIIKRTPTADLWVGQSDEGEFGFTYSEADEVLYRYIDKSKTINLIEAQGFKNTKRIISRYKSNLYKQKVPYAVLF